MKRPAPFALARDALPTELAAFARLLGPPDRELGERADVLPFFARHRKLAALIGMSYSRLAAPDRVKTELSLFGDCTCDLVVGSAANGRFCFVEFEDATPTSAFQSDSKGMPSWSPRLEHGLSQLVDWFYLLSDQSQTQQFRSFFSTDLVDYCGLLVIGRSAFLDENQQHRLRWRSQNTLIAGRPVWIVTFDELYSALAERVNLLAHSAKPAARKKPKKR